MAKRTKRRFDRRPQDFYTTPRSAVQPLVAVLPMTDPHAVAYVEPCAGDGALIRHLDALTDDRLVCIDAYDIAPRHRRIRQADASVERADFRDFVELDEVLFITNPPWRKELLLPIIDNLRRQAPTWLLLYIDWACNRYAAPYMRYCSHVVPAGRPRWFGTQSAKDNVAWFRFVGEPATTILLPRPPR